MSRLLELPSLAVLIHALLHKVFETADFEVLSVVDTVAEDTHAVRADVVELHCRLLHAGKSAMVGSGILHLRSPRHVDTHVLHDVPAAIGGQVDQLLPATLEQQTEDGLGSHH